MLSPGSPPDSIVAAKPTGAYRPPGARGTLASDAYKRDENDHTAAAVAASAPGSAPGSGASTPAIMFRGGKPAGRYTPGLPPGAAPVSPAGGAKEEKKKRVRSKRPLKDGAGGHLGEGGAEETTEAVEGLKAEDAAPAAGASGDEAVQKKIRGLNKKVSLTQIPRWLDGLS